MDDQTRLALRDVLNRHIRELYGLCRTHEGTMPAEQRTDVLAACARLNRAAGNSTPYQAFILSLDPESPDA